MIDNKKAFNIYSAIRLLIYAIASIVFVLMSISLVFKVKLSFMQLLGPDYGFVGLYLLLGFFLIFLAFRIYDYLIKPAYVEMIFKESEVIVRTYSPTNWTSIFFISGYYTRFANEIKLNKQEYSNYKLQIDKMGFRKLLKLQKLNKAGVFETSAINISLFGLKKYTNIVLTIERLQGKINFN